MSGTRPKSGKRVARPAEPPDTERSAEADVQQKRDEAIGEVQRLIQCAEQVDATSTVVERTLLKSISEAATRIDNMARSIGTHATSALRVLERSKINFDRQRILVLFPFVILSAVIIFLYEFVNRTPTLLGVTELAAVLSTGGATTLILSFHFSRQSEGATPSLEAGLYEEREQLSSIPSRLSERLLESGTVATLLTELRKYANQSANTARVLFPKVDALFEALDRRERLRRFKSQIRLMTGRFRLPLSSSMESRLERYRSPAGDEGIWLGDLLPKLAETTGLAPQLLTLLYYESVADEASTRVSWQTVLQSPSLRDALVKWIVGSGCVSVPGQVDESVATSLLRLTLGVNRTTFALDETQRDFGYLAATFLRVTSQIERMDREYNLGLRYEGGNLEVGSGSAENIEQDLLLAVTRYNSELTIGMVRLLYYCISGGPALESEFNHARESSDLKATLILLKNRAVLGGSLELEYLLEIARSRRTFVVTELQLLGSEYSELWDFTTAFQPFLSENGLTAASERLQFTELLRICPPSGRLRAAEQLGAIASRLTTLATKDVKSSSLSLVALALFLHQSHHSAVDSLCRIAARDEVSCRVLYCYIELLDAGGLTAKAPPLSKAVEVYDQGQQPDEHFEAFRAELARGNLFTSKRSLLSYQIEAVRLELREHHGEVMALEESVANVLKARLDFHAIDELLISNALSAYIVTVPPRMRQPVMDFLDSDELRSLSANETPRKGSHENRRLVMLDRTPSGSGRGTRVGLVPPGLTFAQFAVRLDTGMASAVRAYNSRTHSTLPESVPLFIMRILPAGEAMYVTAGEHSEALDQEEESAVRPELAIKRLVLEELSADAQVDLLGATVRASTPSLAVKQVLRLVLESPQSNLLSLARERLASEIKKVPGFATLNVQNRIEQAFCRGRDLVAACLQLHDQDVHLGRTQSRSEFRERILTSLPCTVTQDDAVLNRVLEVLYRLANDIGTTFALVES